MYIFLSNRAEADAKAIRARYSTETGYITKFFIFIIYSIYLDTYAELKKKMRFDVESLLAYMVRSN
jgi:hypothetical protein